MRFCGWKNFAIGVVSLFVLVACWDLLSRALGREITPGFMGDVLKSAQAQGAVWILVVGFCVAAPLSEEFLARGFLFRDDSQCRIRTLSPLHLEKDVEFYELTLKAGGALVSSPHYEGTREFLTVEEGTVRLTSGEETRDLAKGDSAHYPADVPHRIENIGRGQAVAFLVDIYGRAARNR